MDTAVRQALRVADRRVVALLRDGLIVAPVQPTRTDNSPARGGGTRRAPGRIRP
ncbi:hypothetical protein ACWKT5_26875 [Streptomyces avermitilis]